MREVGLQYIHAIEESAPQPAVITIESTLRVINPESLLVVPAVQSQC